MEERMTPAEYATWTQRRKLGRWLYVLRHGVLTKGSIFATLMLALQWAGVFGRTAHLSPAEWILRFVWLAVLYGGITAWLDWSSAEGRYAEGPESDDPEPEIQCLKCGVVIPSGQSRCESCGWTFEEAGDTSGQP